MLTPMTYKAFTASLAQSPPSSQEKQKLAESLVDSGAADVALVMLAALAKYTLHAAESFEMLLNRKGTPSVALQLLLSDLEVASHDAPATSLPETSFEDEDDEEEEEDCM